MRFSCWFMYERHVTMRVEGDTMRDVTEKLMVLHRSDHWCGLHGKWRINGGEEVTDIETWVADSKRNSSDNERELLAHLRDVEAYADELLGNSLPRKQPMRVKRIQWSKPSPPNGQCGYNHVYGDTPFGRFLITWKGWKDDNGFTLDLSPCGEFYSGETLEDVQQHAQEQLENSVSACLDS